MGFVREDMGKVVAREALQARLAAEGLDASDNDWGSEARLGSCFLNSRYNPRLVAERFNWLCAQFISIGEEKDPGTIS